MSYCILRQDARRDYWAGLGLHGVAANQRLRGGLLEQVELPVQVQLSVAGTLRSDLVELPSLVVSPAMRNVFERVGLDNIQYFPAQLKADFAENVVEGYWFAHVIGLVSCVDRQTATYESDDPSGALQGFQVDDRRCYDLSMFRLAEDPRIVLIHTRVRAALEAARLHGLLFQETTSYTGYRVSSAPAEIDENNPGAAGII